LSTIRCTAARQLPADFVEKLRRRKIARKNWNMVRGKRALANIVSGSGLQREGVLQNRPTLGGNRVFQHNQPIVLKHSKI
jgi:hypothetical protein